MIAICISVICVCLLFSSFFSSADISFSSVNRLKLEKESKKGNKTAKKVLKYIDNYSSTISTILFGNNLVNIVASSFGALLSIELFPNNSFGPLIVEVVMLILIITFGEIIPKSFSKPYAYSLSLTYVYIISVIKFIFKPIVWVTTKLTSFICKPFLTKKRKLTPSDDELDQMIEEIAEEGFIDESQTQLLHRSIDFKETSAHEIMTPRVAIQGIDYKENLSNWVKSNLPISKSRIIVFNGNADKIVGYIPTKTLLKACLLDDHISMNSVILPILAIPGTMEISSVLSLMKKSHHHIAVVKDEYGGTDGILTLEDILEELVGEMYDENDKGISFITETSKKNVFLVSGKMDIDNLFERFKLDDDKIDEDYATVSGWIIDKLGRFANVGDAFEYEKIDVKITQIDNYTVKEAKITYHPRRKKND